MERIFFTKDNFSRLRDRVKKEKGKEIIFSSDDDEFNRKVLEKLDIGVLMIKLKERKDFQKQRNSGFNQVLARIAKKRNVCIGICFDEIVASSGLEKAEILSRIKQNIKLCNKAKVKMKFILENYERNIYDLKSLGLVLGMPTWMLKYL